MPTKDNGLVGIYRLDNYPAYALIQGHYKQYNYRFLTSAKNLNFTLKFSKIKVQKILLHKFIQAKLLISFINYFIIL